MVTFLYIDPGSGSYLLQVIIATILGGAFFFKRIWAAIVQFFSGKTKNDNKTDLDEKL